jgi:hypothetical protein
MDSFNTDVDVGGDERGSPSGSQLEGKTGSLVCGYCHDVRGSCADVDVGW